MGPKKTNSLSDPQQVHSVVQTLAREIASAPISLKKYQALSKKLNSALQTIQGIEAEKTTNLFAKAQAENLKEEVVKLYGDLENGLVQREVSQIQEESTSLRQGRLTFRAVKQLEKHINELEKNHLPSLPDRRIIADAKVALVEAKARLEGKPIKRHFDYLAEQSANVKFVEEILPEEVEELFDVAKAVYNRDLKIAKARYYGLPSKNRDAVEKHLQNLMATAFDKNDPLPTIQALIATANDLADNGEGNLYYTQTKIDELFLGLSQLGTDEKNDKVVSLKVIQGGFLQA